jgi:hypothetical protein
MSDVRKTMQDDTAVSKNASSAIAVQCQLICKIKKTRKPSEEV